VTQTVPGAGAYRLAVTRAVVLAAGIVVAALLGAADGAAVQAQNPRLLANVGPDMQISLRTAGGAAVTKLDPGTYDIEVTDQSEFHNFELVGPGVTRLTGIETTGTVTWTVTFANGTYRFQCGVHPSTMRGTFTAGTVQAPPKVKTITPKTRLVLTSGPAEVITLKTAAGAVVKQLKRGTYNVTVRDRGRTHNARLRGPGYNRATKPLTYTGTQKWKVALKRAGSLRFLCDPHAVTGMKGSAKIVR
jgi:plastocyanin